MPYMFASARQLLSDSSEKAMDALAQAEMSASGGAHDKAETWAEIGDAYARLAQAAADALGDVR